MFDMIKEILFNKTSENLEDLPRPRLRRTVFVNEDEWLPLVSVECEE